MAEYDRSISNSSSSKEESPDIPDSNIPSTNTSPSHQVLNNKISEQSVVSERTKKSPPNSLPVSSWSVNVSDQPVKNVQCSIAELGLDDDQDEFWQETPLELPSDGRHRDTENTCYDGADNISYEDLLDFALDGGALQQALSPISDT